ncbi:MAG: FKBP-type peptidyl-prolyl cis-trans isomerase [Treponema sp.]|nr:FKBP-type peptidyl-prolyl cis-trans isomerase [Treponema sp.]
MKKVNVLSVLVLVLGLTVLSSCNRGSSNAESVDRETSYAFGMFVAGFLTADLGLPVLGYDYNAFMDGFRDYNDARETRFTEEQAMDRIIAFLSGLELPPAQFDEELWMISELNREEGEAYMAQNAARSGVSTTSSGLQYEVVQQGTGLRPGINDTVQVHYEGTFLDGFVFDSSYNRGIPAEFPLSMVIEGWTEGLQLMNEGSIYRFVIPPHLGYGVGGIPNAIPPNQTLIFRVELLSVER